MFFNRIIILCDIHYNKFYSLDKNAPPKANAGGDQVVTAPISALIINGSQSSDDLRIGQWLWTRDQSSLAIGTIVQNTDKSPVLMVKLKYQFHLIVYIMCTYTNTYMFVSFFIANRYSSWSLCLSIKSNGWSRSEQWRHCVSNCETRLVSTRNISPFCNVIT